MKFTLITTTLFVSIGALTANEAQIFSVYRNLSNESSFVPIDIDEDGDLDLIAATVEPFTSGPASVAAYYQEADGSFQGPFVVSYHATTVAGELAFGKRNSGDPFSVYRATVLFSASTISQFQLGYITYPFLGGNSISRGEAPIELAINTSSLVVEDIDDDGFLDFVTLNPDNTISISWGNGQSVTVISSIPANFDFSQFIGIVDVDQDGFSDILYENDDFSNEGISVIRQSSTRTFAAPQMLQLQDGSEIDHADWQFADLDGDGTLDFYEADFNFGNGVVELTYILNSSLGYQLPVTIDLDSQFEEVCSVITSPGQSARFLSLVESDDDASISLVSFTFDAPNIISKEELDVSIGSEQPSYRSPIRTKLISDINADGFLDILLNLERPNPRNESPNFSETLQQLCIGFGQVDGSFDFVWQGDSPLTGDIELLGDFNNDGFTDYIVGENVERNLVLITNENGRGWNRVRALDELLPETWNR